MGEDSQNEPKDTAVEAAVSTSVESSGKKLTQLDLFEGLLRGNKYTNSFEFYDLAPKYVVGLVLDPDSGEAVDVKQRPYLPTQVRRFMYHDQELILELSPARVRQKGGGERDMFPGRREQVIEDALRRIAIEKHRTRYEQDMAGVTFSFHELRKELEARGHGFPFAEIKEAIRVANKCNMTVKGKNGEQLVSSPLFPVIAIDGRGENGKAYVAFNPLVTKGILDLDFRQLNYETSMGMKSSIGRWLHRRLTHRYTQASYVDNGYNIKASTIIRDSGLCNYSRLRDALRAVEEAVEELKTSGVINNFTSESLREGRKRVDTKYVLFPSGDFIAEMKRANHHQRSLRAEREQVEAAQAAERAAAEKTPRLHAPSKSTAPRRRAAARLPGVQGQATAEEQALDLNTPPLPEE